MDSDILTNVSCTAFYDQTSIATWSVCLCAWPGVCVCVCVCVCGMPADLSLVHTGVKLTCHCGMGHTCINTINGQRLGFRGWFSLATAHIYMSIFIVLLGKYWALCLDNNYVFTYIHQITHLFTSNKVHRTICSEPGMQICMYVYV